MQIFKSLIVLNLLALLVGCNYMPRLDEVLPDKRTEYQSSRDLPALEVPPDLTSDTINESMAIPGEEGPNTLSAYEQQQRNAALSVDSSGALPNEQTLVVRGDRYAVWPELGRFFKEQGHTLELDDAELGVLETAWSEPQNTDAGEVRERFDVFAEPGQKEGTTQLFISHQQQRRTGPDEPWNDAGSNTETQQRLVAEMGAFFGGPMADAATVAEVGGTGSAPAPQGTGSRVPRAEIVNTEAGDVYLSLPNAYDQAWGRTETALTQAGMQIRSADPEAGEYLIAYSSPGNEENKSWFDKLKFWSDDEPPVYRIRLSGTGDRTEVAVRDEKGNGVDDDKARPILGELQRQYNKQL